MRMRNVAVQAILVCLYVGLASNVSSQAKSSATGTLRGTFVDFYEHAPIGKAFIFVHGYTGNEHYVKVDDQGRFSADLTPGVYDVFVSTSGFDPACRKIEVLAGKTSVYNVQMKASTVGMQD